MRFLSIALMLCSSPAVADCGMFTHETRPPGEVVATFDEGARTLTVADANGSEVRYELQSAGSGLPYWVGTSEDGEEVAVREHKGEIIVDMMVYEAFCR